jgi:galactokinase
MEPTVFLRDLHVVGEMERVSKGIDALRENDLPSFGKLMFESHDSSKNNFANSSSELDLLVSLARSLPGVFGARLSGGGFGGITVHLVMASEAVSYAEQLSRLYRQHSGHEIDTMICAAAAGAEVY